MTDDQFEQQLRGFLAAREPAAVSPVLRARLQSVTAESPVRSGGWIGWLGGAWRATVGLAAVAAVAVVLLAVLLRTDALTVRDPAPGGSAVGHSGPCHGPVRDRPRRRVHARRPLPRPSGDSRRSSPRPGSRRRFVRCRPRPARRRSRSPTAGPSNSIAMATRDRDVMAVIGIAPDGTPVCCLTLTGDLIERAQSRTGCWRPIAQPGGLDDDLAEATAEAPRWRARSTSCAASRTWLRGSRRSRRKGSPATISSRSFSLLAILGAAPRACRSWRSDGGPSRWRPRTAVERRLGTEAEMARGRRGRPRRSGGRRAPATRLSRRRRPGGLAGPASGGGLVRSARSCWSASPRWPAWAVVAVMDLLLPPSTSPAARRRRRRRGPGRPGPERRCRSCSSAIAIAEPRRLRAAAVGGVRRIGVIVLVALVGWALSVVVDHTVPSSLDPRSRAGSPATTRRGRLRPGRADGERHLPPGARRDLHRSRTKIRNPGVAAADDPRPRMRDRTTQPNPYIGIHRRAWAGSSSPSDGPITLPLGEPRRCVGDVARHARSGRGAGDHRSSVEPVRARMPTDVVRTVPLNYVELAYRALGVRRTREVALPAALFLTSKSPCTVEVPGGQVTYSTPGRMRAVAQGARRLRISVSNSGK